MVCLARNREREDILEQLQVLLMQSREHTVHVYAQEVTAPIDEIISGVDFEVFAVGVYVADAKKNRVIVTGYGDSLLEAMRSVKWTDFVQRIFGKGVDTIR